MQGHKCDFRKFQVAFFLLLLTIFPTHQALCYDRPASISQEAWDKVAPYLLPENHPVKAVLDSIFSTSRATLSVKSLEKAGFMNCKPRKWTHLVVCTHPSLSGYIVKTYLDSQRYFGQKTEYDHWLSRIRGVELINREIAIHHWEKLFKTPKKWIYLLPEYPAPPKEFIRKNFILIEEDVYTLDASIWKSELVTYELLDAFYRLLEDLGLNDCAKPENAPFCIDGKIAFIDTESHDAWPVRYKKMVPYLAPKMQDYWKVLTSQ